jgi:hypothetical protein
MNRESASLGVRSFFGTRVMLVLYSACVFGVWWHHFPWFVATKSLISCDIHCHLMPAATLCPTKVARILSSRKAPTFLDMSPIPSRNTSGLTVSTFVCIPHCGRFPCVRLKCWQVNLKTTRTSAGDERLSIGCLKYLGIRNYLRHFW